MDFAQQEDIDDSMQVLAIGEAILAAAEQSMPFAAWLAHFLDGTLTESEERARFGFLTPTQATGVAAHPEELIAWWPRAMQQFATG
jgi:hypothetical protein